MPGPDPAQGSGGGPDACIICTRDPAPGWLRETGTYPLCAAPDDADPDQVSCRDLWLEIMRNRAVPGPRG